MHVYIQIDIQSFKVPFNTRLRCLKRNVATRTDLFIGTGEALLNYERVNLANHALIIPEFLLLISACCLLFIYTLLFNCLVFKKNVGNINTDPIDPQSCS